MDRLDVLKNTLNTLKYNILLFFLNLLGITFKRRLIEKEILNNKICKLHYLGKKKINNDFYLIYRLKFPNNICYDIHRKYKIKPYNYTLAKKLYNYLDYKFSTHCTEYFSLGYILTPIFNIINTNCSKNLSDLFIGNKYENTCKYNGQNFNAFYVLSKEFGLNFCYLSLFYYYKIYIFNIPSGIFYDLDYEGNLIQKGFLFTKKQREKAVENIKKLPLGWDGYKNEI